MVTVVCQRTGIEFDARSKASKNHPRVVSALDRVVKSSAGRRAYGLLMEALESLGRKPGLDEFDSLADAAIEAAKADRQEYIASWLQSRRRPAKPHVDEEEADRAAFASATSGEGRTDIDSDSRYDDVA